MPLGLFTRAKCFYGTFGRNRGIAARSDRSAR
jgi:hypothetical protein